MGILLIGKKKLFTDTKIVFIRTIVTHIFLCTEKALKSLLESLTCPPYTPTQHLEREQALAKEFAEILHFTLRFDELKVSEASLLLYLLLGGGGRKACNCV